MNKCTCECPDGVGQHLENCEIYLRRWEQDYLAKIHLRAYQIQAAMGPRDSDRKLVTELIETVCKFVCSTNERGMECCISDPESVIRVRLRTEPPMVIEGRTRYLSAQERSSFLDEVCS